MNEPNDSRWYREPMMWLVVAIPLALLTVGVLLAALLRRRKRAARLAVLQTGARH